MKLHRNESKTFRLKMDDKKPQIAFDIIVLNYAIKKRQKYLVRKTQLPRLDRFLF